MENFMRIESTSLRLGEKTKFYLASEWHQKKYLHELCNILGLDFGNIIIIREYE